VPIIGTEIFVLELTVLPAGKRTGRNPTARHCRRGRNTRGILPGKPGKTGAFSRKKPPFVVPQCVTRAVRTAHRTARWSRPRGSESFSKKIALAGCPFSLAQPRKSRKRTGPSDRSRPYEGLKTRESVQPSRAAATAQPKTVPGDTDRAAASGRGPRTPEAERAQLWLAGCFNLDGKRLGFGIRVYPYKIQPDWQRGVCPNPGPHYASPHLD
jgi:hypothetical protein